LDEEGTNQASLPCRAGFGLFLGSNTFGILRGTLNLLSYFTSAHHVGKYDRLQIEVLQHCDHQKWHAYDECVQHKAVQQWPLEPTLHSTQAVKFSYSFNLGTDNGLSTWQQVRLEYLDHCVP
jgi:hypothetical protein